MDSNPPFLSLPLPTCVCHPSPFAILLLPLLATGVAATAKMVAKSQLASHQRTFHSITALDDVSFGPSLGSSTPPDGLLSCPAHLCIFQSAAKPAPPGFQLPTLFLLASNRCWAVD